VVIANNTIVDLTDGAAIAFSDGFGNDNGAGARTLLAENVTIANNLVRSFQDPLFQGAQGEGFVFENNITFGNVGLQFVNNPEFQVVNPQISRDADGIFRLNSNSPAIDAAFTGFASATGGIDIDGQARGASFDIGADEFSSDAVLNGPLSGADVGHDFAIGNPPAVEGPPPEAGFETEGELVVAGTFVDGGLGVVVQSDEFNANIDANGDGDAFIVINDSDAFGGTAVVAPSGSRVTTATNQDAVLSYEIQFTEAGTYTAYYRARGFGTSTDSFFTPSNFGDSTPFNDEGISRNGEFRYETGDQFTVRAVDLDGTLQFNVGKRESGAQLDAIVFHLDANLSDAELDALFA